MEERERARAALTDAAREDSRIVAAAAVGSSAQGGDRWSDLDLSFGVAGAADVSEVLNDWTTRLQTDFQASVLFDLPFLSSIYRVFLLPGNLQVDLSFTPEQEFGALGPRFQLLFGQSVERTTAAPAGPDQVFGLGVHHAVRGYLCIKRGRYWQAEYWISGVRDQALALACERLGLSTSHGRGFDDLPAGILDDFARSLVGELTENALRKALAVSTRGLLRETEGKVEVSTQLRKDIEELCS